MTAGIMYDSAAGAFPANSTHVALYVNGRFAYTAAPEAQWTRVLWIDVLATNPHGASILDIERGDATPAAVPSWCGARYDAFPDSLLRLYCNLSTWPAVRAEVRTMAAALRQRVRYWIADPTGTPHIVNGADATQWAWGAEFDTSSFLDTF